MYVLLNSAITFLKIIYDGLISHFQGNQGLNESIMEGSISIWFVIGWLFDWSFTKLL